VGVAVAISLPKVGREIYWMRHPQFYAVFDGGRWQDYRTMAGYLSERADPKADRCRTPRERVVHYWSGVICRTAVQRNGRRYEHFHDLPPDEFARMAVRSRYTFIAVPMDEGEWSRDVVLALTRAGTLKIPPERFGDLTLFERKIRGGLQPPGEGL